MKTVFNRGFLGTTHDYFMNRQMVAHNQQELLYQAFILWKHEIWAICDWCLII